MLPHPNASESDDIGNNPVSKANRIGSKYSAVDPLAVFLADPESHLSDILYLYFRIYKKKVIWSFFERAINSIGRGSSETFSIADIGASAGFDLVFLLRKLTNGFSSRIPFKEVRLSLVEGDEALIEMGKQLLGAALPSEDISFEYQKVAFEKGIPLETNSQEILICSEVVEHLQRPEDLFDELYRILKPGGFVIFTTDNSPNLFQRLRRVPIWLQGEYHTAYAKCRPEDAITGWIEYGDERLPIYGHINLKPSRHWEKLAVATGFNINSYGTYESIRRGGGSKSPFALACYFTAGALVYYLLPPKIARFFGDTTALLLSKRFSDKRSMDRQ